jgi:hypothetical protein
VRSKVVPQAKSKKQNILVDRDPSHGHGHVGCALRANSLVAIPSVAKQLLCTKYFLRGTLIVREATLPAVSTAKQ